MTAYPFQGGAPFLLLTETPPTFGRSIRFFHILREYFLLILLACLSHLIIEHVFLSGPVTEGSKGGGLRERRQQQRMAGRGAGRGSCIVVLLHNQEEEEEEGDNDAGGDEEKEERDENRDEEEEDESHLRSADRQLPPSLVLLSATLPRFRQPRRHLPT